MFLNLGWLDGNLLLAYDFHAVGHRGVGQPRGKCEFEILKGASCWNQDDLVLFKNLEIEHRLEHIVLNVDIELQILLSEFVKDLQKASEESETRVLLSEPHD